MRESKLCFKRRYLFRRVRLRESKLSLLLLVVERLSYKGVDTETETEARAVDTGAGREYAHLNFACSCVCNRRRRRSDLALRCSELFVPKTRHPRHEEEHDDGYVHHKQRHLSVESC